MCKFDSWDVLAIHARPHPTAAEQMQVTVHGEQHTARVGAADDTVRGLSRYADRVIKTGIGAGCRTWKHDIGKVLRQTQPQGGRLPADCSTIKQLHLLAGGLCQIALQFRRGKPDSWMVI